MTHPYRVPHYPRDTDYSTNAASYYDDLARKNELMKHLAMRIWEYDKELSKRFDQWDKMLQDGLAAEVIKQLTEWLNDGTLSDVISGIVGDLFNDLFVMQDITVTVGVGGDYATLSQAIAAYADKIPQDDATVEIRLLSGFQLAEQIRIEHKNLSHLRITSVDPFVNVSGTPLSETIQVNISPEFTVAAVIVGKNAVLPSIETLFDMEPVQNILGTGIFLDNASVHVGAEKGFINAPFIGLCAINGSNATAAYSNFSGAGNRSSLTAGNYSNSYGDGFRIWSSTLNASYANADSCGDMGFNISQASNALLNYAHANNCGHHGLLVTTGSVCAARNSEFLNALDDNVTVYASGSLDARNSNFSGAINGGGLVVTRSSSANFENGIANNCGNGGIYANRASQIDAYGATVMDCADNNVTSGNGSIVNFTEGISTGSALDNIHCTHGSIVSAHGATLTGAGRNGVLAYAGNVYVDNANLDNAVQHGVEATRGGFVSASYATLRNAGENGILAYGSNVHANNAIITGAGSRGIEATQGGNVQAYAVNATGSLEDGFCVFNGGVITAVSVNGTLNRTPNVISVHGYIVSEEPIV